MYKLSASIGA